jgi:regulator of sigma E protease
MCLIAAMSVSEIANYALVILEVAFALGFVIFVHELGHFMVARWCGVKCEKFMIGFDVGGLKLSRKWGETVYGIGIIPFGGYVKMMGQDDNPANIAEQMRESQTADPANAKEMVGPDGQTYLVDRRSYLAKSVPQRMAIISAGVTMNIIFAFIFAVVAYKVGVPYSPSVVSGTAPGSPAWRADLQAGDEIVRVGKIDKPSYDDLRGSVMLGDLENGVTFVIQRDGEQFTKTITPERDTGLARVGIMPPESLIVSDEMPVTKGSAAAQAKPPLEKGDEIVAVNGTPVKSYGEYAAILAQNPDKPLTLKVRRKSAEKGAATNEMTVEMPPAPTLTLGLVMPMGKIVAVQDNSPAAAAKIQPGETIEKVSAKGAGSDGKSFDDPLKLPEDLRRLAEQGGEVTLTLRAEGAGATHDVTIPLRKVDRIEEVLGADDPVSIPALGLAFQVGHTVKEVQPETPAAKAGLQAGDVITKAELILPPEIETKKNKPEAIEFENAGKAETADWPILMAGLQRLPAGTQVKLSYKRGDQQLETGPLTPVIEAGYFEPLRGVNFEWIKDTRVASDWNEAIALGWRETTHSLGMVYRFLDKLATRQVPATALAGPLSIPMIAGMSAFQGVGKLLTFLTMLSANLAVINFLPIPLLDGGHMVFLVWEGLRGRPASERFVVAMHTVGFVFIITLMLFVISLDLGLIHRNL